MFRSSISLLFVICGLALALAAQTPKPTVDNDIIRVESRLVIVPVSVTDNAGQPVAGLRKENFTIAEDGRRQEIDQVSDAENTPLEIGLLIDVSGSVNPLFDFEIKAAARFLESVMKADDRATIFLIGDKPISDLTRENAAQAAARVRTIRPSGKFTAFYDTVSLAANYLRKNAPLKSRRVIVALTDGEDNWSDLTRTAEMATYRNLDISQLTQEKLNKLAASTEKAHINAQNKILRDLQNADTVFYSINPAGDSYKLNTISKRAQTGMTRFANDTGGSAFLPKFVSTSMKDPLQNPANVRKNEAVLDSIFTQLAGELRAQYLIQYYSEVDLPLNKYVKLDVAVPGRTGTRVRARQGYYMKK